MSSLQQIRCRQIEDTDAENVVDFLTNGFRNRSRAFWRNALDRLAAHTTPPGLPKYGYLLEARGSIVGVLLLIFTSYSTRGEDRVKCSVSSWYVDPDFRSFAPMLVSKALKHKHVTYINITPAAHTLPILEAQGFHRYCAGRLVALAAIAAPRLGTRVQAVTPETQAGEDLHASEIELLRAHADYGCMSLICSSKEGRRPFIFSPRRRRGFIRCAHLVYCRQLDDFVHAAGPLGRYLAWRGFPLVVLDTNGPVPGLLGKRNDNEPKYYRGPHRPDLGDLTFTERAMFGL